MRTLLTALLGLCAFACVLAEPPKTPEKAAKVVVTGELACLHCHFGIGDGCAVAMKLDDKTPLVLEGDAAKELFARRMKKETYVVEGTLKLKDKQMVLIVDKSHAYDAKAKGNDPEPGLAYVSGDACCGKCDLEQCDVCTLAVRNPQPIILDGNLAQDHAEGKGTLLVTGKLKIDARGLLRLDATKVDSKK